MTDFYKIYDSEFYCKICNKKMFEYEFIYGQARCSCGNYIFDYIYTNNILLIKEESFIINDQLMEINYLKKTICIDELKFNIIEFDNLELTEVKETISLNTAKEIYKLFNKYKNII